DDGAGLQRGALEDRGVVRLLEDHAPGLLDGLDLLVRVTPDRRPGDGPDAGDSQVDPFDRVARVVPVGVPVELLVRLVEAAGDLLPPFVVERAGRGGHPDLERLPVVAQVGAAREDGLGEALAFQVLGGLALKLAEDLRGLAEGELAGDVRAY